MPRYTAPIPPLVAHSQVEKIAALQRREIDLVWEFLYPFERLLLDWRTRIERLFLSTFVISVRPDRQAVWSPERVASALEAELFEPLRRERASIEQEMLPIAQERQRAIFLLAALFARWQVSLGGLDTPEPLPSPATHLLTVDGLGLRPRARVWGQVFQQKAERAVRTAVLTSETLPETLAHVDTISHGYTQQLGNVVKNEAARAAATGEHAALIPFRGRLLELWIAKPDACVTICRPLHLTVTSLVPVQDSHPSCRCEKVPLTSVHRPAPSAFSTFVQRYD